MSDHLPLGIDVFENIKLFKPKTIKYVNIVNLDMYKSSFSNLGNRMDDFDTLIKNIQNAKNGASYKIRIKQGEGNDLVTTEFMNLIKKRTNFIKYVKKINVTNILIYARNIILKC